MLALSFGYGGGVVFSGLVRGGFQSEFREASGQDPQDGGGVFPVPEGTIEVVRIPDEGGLPSQVGADHAFEPEVEHVEQVDVGQHGGDDACPGLAGDGVFYLSILFRGTICVTFCFSAFCFSAPPECS